jgi:hypothetical protein
VFTNLWRSLARRSISLKALIVGLVAGLSAASFTDITPLLVSLSKSIAPPLPAMPVKKPDSLASFPKNTGLMCVKAVCVSPAWQPEHDCKDQLNLALSSVMKVAVLPEPVPSQ